MQGQGRAAQYHLQLAWVRGQPQRTELQDRRRLVRGLRVLHGHSPVGSVMAVWCVKRSYSLCSCCAFMCNVSVVVRDELIVEKSIDMDSNRLSFSVTNLLAHPLH